MVAIPDGEHMKDRLASRLLARVMEWDERTLAAERPVLQALASYKYDSYQQFAPGMRFVASLAVWLAQLDPEDRPAAYEFARRRLVFVSGSEMEHLVGVAFHDHVRPFLIKSAAERAGRSQYAVGPVVASREYRRVLRETLYLGLSDGARVDVFRRSGAPDVVHEQVAATYQLSGEKVADMRAELARDLEVDSADAQFKTVVLLDDFSASGKSYLRRREGGGHKGKVARVLKSLFEADGEFQKAGLINADDVRVCLLLYVATGVAKERIEALVREWLESHGRTGTVFEVIVIQTIPESVRVTAERDPDLLPVLERHGREVEVDRHLREGRHDRPFLGFDEGALPVVLVHNTPNNSVRLLWQDEGGVKGLFPRVSRHKTAA